MLYLGNNLEAIFEKDIYVKILDRLYSEDVEIDSEISLTYPEIKMVQGEETNMETENVEILVEAVPQINVESTEPEPAVVEEPVHYNYNTLKDILSYIELDDDLLASKFSYYLNLKNDIDDEKLCAELDLNYQGNDVITVKLLKDKETYAIASDEIINTYVSLNRYFTNEMKEKIGSYINFGENKRLKLASDDYLKIKDDVKNIIISMLSEESFSSEDNKVLQKDGKDIEVKAYTLTLTQEELGKIIEQVLLNIENNDELLKKLVIYDDTVLNIEYDENATTVEENEIISIQDINVENINEDNNENSNEEINIEEVPAEEINFETAETFETEVENQDVQEENYNLQAENTFINIDLSSDDDDEIVPREIDYSFATYENIFMNLLIGNKVDYTINELKEIIDHAIKDFKGITGDGLKITLYRSSDKLERVYIVMPNSSTIEFDIEEQSSNTNSIKITALYNGNKSILGLDNSAVKYYTANDLLPNDKEEENVTKTGFTLEISRTQKDSNTVLNIVYGFVEDEKINRKFIIDMTTKGQANSNSITNDLNVSYIVKTQETKFSMDSTIKFKDLNDIDSLNEQNCLYLENYTSEEEYQNMITSIVNRINYVLEEKKNAFNIINTSQSRSTKTNVEKLTSDIEREAQYKKASEALQQGIISLMQQKQDEGQEFSLADLEGFSIEGHEVEVTLEENNARIVIDGFPFNLSSEMRLTDAE